MGLADIAAGIEVTEEQRDRGVAAMDRTTGSLADRLSEYAGDLPCSPADAATVVEAYAAGKSVGASARVAGIAPITAAKALHLFGERISPLAPRAREIVRDWLAADLSRSEALALTGATEQEFALAVYVETHDPIDGAREAVAGALTDRSRAVTERATLAETMSDVGELF